MYAVFRIVGEDLRLWLCQGGRRKFIHDVHCGYTRLCGYDTDSLYANTHLRYSPTHSPLSLLNQIAPEVLEDSQEGYQRSVDMWSVGVIIYVSLSGTFPFNEDEDIRDQMRNAAFMFPKDVWRNISKAGAYLVHIVAMRHHSNRRHFSIAIHVITCLLKVDPKDRYTEDQTIQHAWMRDKQLYNDCKQLEAQVREDYITRYLRVSTTLSRMLRMRHTHVSHMAHSIVTNCALT